MGRRIHRQAIFTTQMHAPPRSDLDDNATSSGKPDIFTLQGVTSPDHRSNVDISRTLHFIAVRLRRISAIAWVAGPAKAESAVIR